MPEFKVLNKILQIPDQQVEVFDSLFYDFQKYEASNDSYHNLFSQSYATDEMVRKFTFLSKLIWNLKQANSISDQEFLDSLLANIKHSQVNLRYKDRITLEDLIKEILYHEVMFRHPSESDYIQTNFENSFVSKTFPQLTQPDFLDKDGLVYAKHLTLRECGIELGNDTIYYSPFIKSDLLRYQVVGLLTKKLMAVSENPSIQLRVAIDPFRYLLNQKPPLTIKKAMAFGPSLDFAKIYSSKDGRFEYFDEYADYEVAKRVQGSISTLENGCKQITIEELDAPSENDFQVGRFAHIIFSRDGQSISHFDCAIKVYSELEYLRRREEYFKSEKYIKVFRLDGIIDFKTVHEICFEFFQDNQLIGEMFK